MSSSKSWVVLRVVTGCVFLAGGVLKVLALGTADFERTLVWQLSGESRTLIIALSVGESTLGAMLCFRLRERLCALALVGLLGVLSVVLLIQVAPLAGAPSPACGCFGRLDSTSTASPVFTAPLLRNAILAAAVVFSVRWRSSPSAVLQVGAPSRD